MKLITHKLFLLTGHSKSISHKVTIKHGYSHVIKVGHIFSRFRRLGVRLVGRGILYDGHCKYCLILRTTNYLTHSIAQKLNNIMFPSSSVTSNTCIYIYWAQFVRVDCWWHIANLNRFTSSIFSLFCDNLDIRQQFYPSNTFLFIWFSTCK